MIIELVINLAVVGLVVWLITNYIPMPGKIAKLIEIIAIILCLVQVLKALGIYGY